MARFVLRVKTKSGQEVMNSLTKDSRIKELKEKLSLLSNIPQNRLQVLSGFPPKPIDISQDEESIGKSGISSGDTLILEEKLPSTSDMAVDNVTFPENRMEEESSFDSPAAGILMKKVVPSDNSCLFTSLQYVLNGKIDETGSVNPYLREVVAETIRSDKGLYNEAILGKPVEDYCRWIQNDTSWGGAIELAILSNHYGVEIAVVDTVNAIINKFGEDQHYPHRVFLLFDGIHYDPLFLEPLDAGKIRTLFSSSDNETLKQAEQIAQEAKSSRQFTDVDKFTLKCMVCNIFLKGQKAAQEHAQSTGHASFGEI